MMVRYNITMSDAGLKLLTHLTRDGVWSRREIVEAALLAFIQEPRQTREKAIVFTKVKDFGSIVDTHVGDDGDWLK
jgi:hypothetical protein